MNYDAPRRYLNFSGQIFDILLRSVSRDFKLPPSWNVQMMTFYALIVRSTSCVILG